MLHYILVVFQLCTAIGGQWCASVPPYIGASHYDTRDKCEADGKAIKAALEGDKYFVDFKCIVFEVPERDKDA